MTSSAMPRIDVAVGLRPGALPGAPLLDDELTAQVVASVERRLGALARTLGVAVRPVVSVTEIPPPVGTAGAASQRISLRLGTRRCRYPVAVPFAAAVALSGRWPDDDPNRTPIRDLPLPDCPVPELVGLVCAEAVRLQPSALLTPEAVTQVLDRLVEIDQVMSEIVPSADWLAEVLTEVLELGISVADSERIAGVLDDRRPTTVREAAEALISELASDSVGLLVPPRLWPELGTGDLTDPDDLLAHVAREVLDQAGIVAPRVELEDPAGRLPPDTFAVRVNHLIGLPQLLLPAGSCLTYDRGWLHELPATSARAVLDPTTERVAVLVGNDDQDLLATLELPTWTEAGYLIARLVTMLTSASWRVISQDLMIAQLDVLEELCPSVVRAARAQLPPAELTALLRALAGGGISLRHLLVVLERVVDLPARDLGIDAFTVLSDPAHVWVGSGSSGAANPTRRLEADLQFVRTGLRYQVGQQYATDLGFLVVYLLDPDLEQLLANPQRGEAADDEILAAIEQEAAQLPLGTAVPVVLAQPDVRPALAALLAVSRPQTVVLSVADLPPTLAVQPVARISLGSEVA